MYFNLYYLKLSSTTVLSAELAGKWLQAVQPLWTEVQASSGEVCSLKKSLEIEFDLIFWRIEINFDF